jgi:tRNA-dihydrouridine synthase
MDGVTDAAFRRLVARLGAPDVTFTEFTHVHDVCRGPAFLLASLRYHPCERPIVAQLYGKDPQLFYTAAHAICELGFDGLDINMGCPSRNVASSGSGAGLIRTPELAHAIMRAARQGIEDWAAGQSLEAAGLPAARAVLIRDMAGQGGDRAGVPRRVIPLSVKTRIGYDEAIADQWISHLLEERPAAISVHGRTLKQMYRGEADWEAIAHATRLVRGTGTLLLGNGDVQSLGMAVRRIHDTGVDGVLIGRGTLGSPWLFRRKPLARAMAGDSGNGEALGDLDRSEAVSLQERFSVMHEHATIFERLDGSEQFRRMRKHLGWYCAGFPGAAAMRAKVFRLSSVAELESVVESYWKWQAQGATTPLFAAEVHATPLAACG